MTDLTIGMPVYNGGELFKRALDCVLGQTYQDFKILIYDNASTDGTAEYADQRARMDSRVTVFHQPENLGAMANFTSVLNAADTDFFCWRAGDDLSCKNYLELLRSALIANPEKDIAVPTVESFTPHGQTRVRPYPRLEGKTGWARRKAMTWRSPPAWIYGLYRTKAIKEVYFPTVKEFPQVWAQDHLILFPFHYSGRSVVVKEAVFNQSEGTSSGHYKPDTRKEQFELLSKFFQQIHEHANEIDGDISFSFRIYRNLFLFHYSQRATTFWVPKILYGGIKR